jgi:hypothetical protein
MVDVYYYQYGRKRMILDAICVVNGPGTFRMYQEDGILYIYTEPKLHEAPDSSLEYEILKGYNRLYLGEAEVVQNVVRKTGRATQEDLVEV